MTLNKDDSFLLQICASKFVIRKLAITKHVCTKWSHFTFIFCSVQMKMQIIYDFFNTKKNLPNIIQQYFFGILLFRIISIPSKTFYFDGMLGTGLPVSMYTTKTPIEKCRFNVTQLKEFFYIFCKRQISIKLFYLYLRLQCTDNYFFKIKFVVFLYLLLSAS